MCGLSGIAYKGMGYEELNVLCTLGILSGHRGDQGVGIIEYTRTQGKGQKIATHKALSHPRDYFANNGGMFKTMYLPRWKKNAPDIIAAHTRFATQGEVKLENQHPFKHGNIIGMHNGTIRGDFSNREKFETDSETLIYNIDKLGVDEAIGELRNKDAAYAVVYVNTKDNTLNFIRNRERKLYFAKGEKAPLYWSSDEKFLNALWPYEKSMNYPAILEEDALYSVPLNSDKYGKDIEKLRSILEKKFYPIQNWKHDDNKGNKSVVNFPQTHGGDSGFKRPDSHGMWETTPNFRVSFDAYRKLIDKGCRGCGTVSLINDSVKFLDSRHYLCKECKNDDTIEYLARADIKEAEAVEKEKEEEFNEMKYYHGMFQ